VKLRPSILLTLLTIWATVLWGAGVPQPLAQNAQPLDAVERVPMPKMDNAVLEARAQVLDAAGPFHFAEAIEVALTPWDSGTWEWLPDGTALWRLRVESPEARSLNLGFTQYAMPAGGQLFLYSADYKSVLGPFTDEYNQPHGQLWTPLVPGSELVVEVQVPGEALGELKLTLGAVNHGFRDIGGSANKSGSCNVDVVCPQGDAWRDQIRSVAVYGTGGTRFCTGALVNNTAQDGRPFFLTANHCGITESNAASVVVYWNYQNSTCRTPGSTASGSAGNGSLSQFNSGAVLRARNSASDFTLLELTAPVPRAVNPFFAGWDRSGANALTSVGIHHPNGEEKRISFDNDPTTITSYLQTTVPGAGTHLRVADWDLGTTEPGSSGSPLFDQNKRIVGQLHGGYAACGNDLADWYGRFSVSWTGGGTSATRLRDWLDPLNTGATVLDGRGLSDFASGGATLIDDTHGTGDGDGVAERGEQGIQLTIPIRNVGSTAATGVSATLASLTPGVTITSAVSTYPNIAAGQTTSNATPFEISIGPAHPCGAPVSLLVEVTSATDSGSFQVILPTGPVCDVIPDLSSGGMPLLVDSTGNGNGNGIADPGESTLEMSFPVSNAGATANGVFAVLQSLTPTASVVQDTSSYPAIPTGQVRLNSQPFVLALHPAHPCGEPVELELHVNSGIEVRAIPHKIPTGAVNPGQTVAVSKTVTPGTVFGANPETVTTPIVVSEAGTVADVDLTVTIPHTWLEDLDIHLRSPSGTTVHLFNRLGGSDDNLTNTTFDDEATLSISSGTAPFTGRFRPFQALSAFDGQPAQGTWQVIVVDNASLDTGVIQSLTLAMTIHPVACAPPKSVNKGDVNKDGAVTPSDAQAAFECFLLGECGPEKDLVAADVAPDDGDDCVGTDDGDGLVTPADAQRIFRMALGIEVPCP
jgi:subtilisin-like proprotein convertase family protein